MKSTLLAILFVGLGLSAQAGNEGAQATPSLPPEVIAEYIFSGGFMVPPHLPASTRCQVLADGRAISIAYYRVTGNPKVKLIKKLTARELAELNKYVGQIKPGQLYDPDPSSPGCQDGPGHRFIINNAYGEITIGEEFACKEKARKNATTADSKVIEFLEKLAKMSR